MAQAQANTTAGALQQTRPYWYKDAIIYQVHVKSFFDSNDDGVGDFKGLTEKLDYIQSLGVNTIWLLPFYPSPMRDDGYDIGNYLDVASEYGTLDDFQQFVQQAHARGLRIITELVINHTSDQHPWFQRARKAPAGSAERDFYVWHDNDQKYADTRIIFTDTETSNWAWDPVAKAYYWHRFFSHQPDLNHNNPAVVDAVIEVMRFWLDMGVDGLRLDAIPYLCVREGTNNENLPETHEVIKRMRAVVDQHYQDKLFLAEANQWPEDVRDYFGDADECHMAYHFPLMPRMYMAVAQEDRHPIVEIMQQTPDIPESCQWAVFLRNHDELTLEMVTDKERDYMYKMYAADPRMRINVGIRRRLASLMENDTARLKLLNSLLLSMPGSPIVYYGDEIGMGDNIYLGDRNGVRTPMQWSPDRNAGFSRARPESLFFQPVRDPVFGYEAVNVEAQSANSSSLLNWMRRILMVRRHHAAFGRGALKFLYPGNRKILAFIREHEDDVILCVANLSRNAQPVELGLEEWHGRTPVEMLGRTTFPPIGHLPYLLTIAGHGFYWFELKTDQAMPEWHEDHSLPEDAPVLVLFDGWRSLFPAHTEATRQALAANEQKRWLHQALPDFVSRQRWFRGQPEPIQQLRCVDYHLAEDTQPLLALYQAEDCTALATQYVFMPLQQVYEQDEARMHLLHGHTVARCRHKDRMGIVADALADPLFCEDLLQRFVRQDTLLLQQGGRLAFQPTAAFAKWQHRLPQVSESTIQFSNNSNGSSVSIFDEQLFFKTYRLTERGEHPELEMKRFLCERAEFAYVTPLLGYLAYQTADGEHCTLGLLQAYSTHQGDAWQYVLGYLERFLESCRNDYLQGEAHCALEHKPFLTMMATLGQRTADLHNALSCDDSRPDFAPEAFQPDALTMLQQSVQQQLQQALQSLSAQLSSLTPNAQIVATQLLQQRDQLFQWIEQLQPAHLVGPKMRYHGNYHLGRLLMVDNDYLITGFEGETTWPMAQRKAKHTPLKDVACMLHSLRFVACTALDDLAESQPDGIETLQPLIQQWLDACSDTYLTHYFDGLAALFTDLSMTQAWPLLRVLQLERVAIELNYDLTHRLDKVHLTLQGLQSMLQADSMSVQG